jgi:formyl-CoA transferase
LRVQNRSVLVPLVEAILKTRTTPVWQDLLRGAEVPHAPVWNYDELFAHPQTAARGFRVTVRDARGNPVDLIGSPFHISGIVPSEPNSPPELGQHTQEVLRELLGLNEDQITQLRKKAII